LAALIKIFNLSPRQVARICGYSRAYVQRAISPRDVINCSPEFFLRLEAALPDLVRGRRRGYFAVPATRATSAEAALRSVTE
jgi:hypothetical protein